MKRLPRATRRGTRATPGLVLAAVMASVACGGASTQTGLDDPGVRLDVYSGSRQVTLIKTDQGGFEDSSRLVVRDQDAWARAWATIGTGTQPPPGTVAPDFGEEIAIVAAMGQRPSGGFSINIDSVARHERGAVVYVTSTSPGPTCMTTQALTQPVHAVRVPRIEGRVAWRERAVVNPCR